MPSPAAQRSVALVILVTAASCTSYRGAEAPADVAADADAGVTPTGEGGEAPCDVTKDFGGPVPLDELDTPGDEGAPRLSEDELTIWFDAQRGDGGDGYGLYTATRARREEPFGAARPVPGTSLDTADHEYAPVVTSDGKKLFFERQNPVAGTSRILFATRADASAPFDAPQPVANLSLGDYDANPFVRGDGSELWFVRANTGLGSVDLEVAHLEPSVGYVTADALPPARGVLRQAPVIAGNGLALYFASSGSTPDLDVYVATRSAVTAPFGTPVPLSTVSSAAVDLPGWVSADGCRLYLASARPGGKGQKDMYVATRPR